MPWKECSVMDERVRFVGRLLDGEKMATLCREFAISRKTSYKIFDRYKESGLEALTDRSRRPWDRHGLVQRRGRKRNHAQGTPLSLGQRPNEQWCTDYKGEFLLGNKKYCYPLTVTDHASRYPLLCD